MLGEAWSAGYLREGLTQLRDQGRCLEGGDTQAGASLQLRSAETGEAATITDYISSSLGIAFTALWMQESWEFGGW